MTNFSSLQSDKDFETFSVPAIAAERILHIDPVTCDINCRRAMKFAAKWMYSVDKQLVLISRGGYTENNEKVLMQEYFE